MTSVPITPANPIQGNFFRINGYQHERILVTYFLLGFGLGKLSKGPLFRMVCNAILSFSEWPETKPTANVVATTVPSGNGDLSAPSYHEPWTSYCMNKNFIAVRRFQTDWAVIIAQGTAVFI
ncbi:hypothetical protein ABW21_db0203892 [Orbilia brochopaga]|nr:hypothetical protein ABW21_db0203892 [Drechslerella brochopaga]